MSLLDLFYRNYDLWTPNELRTILTDEEFSSIIAMDTIFAENGSIIISGLQKMFDLNLAMESDNPRRIKNAIKYAERHRSYSEISEAIRTHISNLSVDSIKIIDKWISLDDYYYGIMNYTITLGNCELFKKLYEMGFRDCTCSDCGNLLVEAIRKEKEDIVDFLLQNSNYNSDTAFTNILTILDKHESPERQKEILEYLNKCEKFPSFMTKQKEFDNRSI